MPVSQEIHDYMSQLAIKGNRQRSTQAYKDAAKKGWVKRRKKVIPKTIAHGE